MIASQPSFIKYISTGIHNHIPLTQFEKKKKEIPKTPYINKFPWSFSSHKFVDIDSSAPPSPQQEGIKYIFSIC